MAARSGPHKGGEPSSCRHCSSATQACAGASAGHLTAADLGNLSGKAQKDIAAQVDFPFQLATGAAASNLCAKPHT